MPTWRAILRRLATMSCRLTDPRSELEAWCQSYVKAFSAYDAVAIAEHWAFPALTTQAGRSFAFKSADHFVSNTGLLLGFYKQQNVDRAVRKLVDLVILSDTGIAMTVEDEMLDSSGAVITTWQAFYVMQKRGGDWKAIMAVADGEVSAWADRGTPLGG